MTGLYVGLGIYLLLVAVLFWFWRRSKARVATAQATTFTERVQKAATAQDFLGIQNVANHVVQVDAHNFRAYVEVQPVNFGFLSGAEQLIMEDAFRQFLDGLRFSIQICVNSVPLDLTEHLQDLRQPRTRLPEHLRAYATELADFTAEGLHRRSTLSKRYVIVVPWRHVPNPKKAVRADLIADLAVQELDVRCQTIIGGLARAQLSARRMTSEQILSYLYQVLNRQGGAELLGRALMGENLESLYVTVRETGEVAGHVVS